MDAIYKKCWTSTSPYLLSQSLPPVRQLDHGINLIPGASPVSLRPYRYNHYQKKGLEKQVSEMLTNGIICHSQSLFTSPALLVKKKDGT